MERFDLSFELVEPGAHLLRRCGGVGCVRDAGRLGCRVICPGCEHEGAGTAAAGIGMVRDLPAGAGRGFREEGADTGWKAGSQPARRAACMK